MDNRNTKMKITGSVLPVLLLPGVAHAHGGPEVFLFIWGILLLPVVIATAIAPAGTRLLWGVGGFFAVLGSFFIIGELFGSFLNETVLFYPYLLIPAATWYRLRRKQQGKRRVSSQA